MAVLLGVLVLLAGPARAQISFPGAAPISAGNVTIYLKPQYTNSTDGVSSTIDRNVVIYGASPDLAFILQNNSFVSNTDTIAGKGGPQRVTANGFGDTVLEGRYTVFQQDGPGSTFRIAPYAGVIMPTGMDNVNGLMPRAGQPGTGAWASRDAVTMSYQTLDWNAAAEAGYQANGAAAGYRFGNTFYADAAFRYRLWPGSLKAVVPAEVYGFVESNYTSTVANRAGGQNVPGTGGQLLLVDPGIIYTARSYSVTLMGFLPAYEQVRNNGSRFNYGVLAMFRYSLFTPHHW
ncbi:MAG: transporter [Rhodospirillales bacterium]|nr:transporter [Rhodospirillales bacterium]